MAATSLTLEEAAERLEISPEEFKKRLKTNPAFRTLVPIRDGATLRFKAAAVEELARELGAASNPELPLAALHDSPPPGSDDFKLPPKAGKRAADEPIQFDDSSSESEVFSLAADAPKGAPKKPKSGSDSDVRLDSGKGKKAKTEEAIPTEEIALDFSGPGSAVIKGGSSAKLSAPKSSGKLTSDAGKSLPKPPAGDSSEFELSLDADSDDFELKLNTDSSDEVAVGEMPKETGSGRRPGAESGILSRKPNDSGRSLEKGKDKPKSTVPMGADSDSDVDFELTLDSSANVSGTKLGAGAKGPKKVTADSDSEFELTLDDSSGGSSLEHAALEDDVAEAEKGDIFETDFEIPPMDESASEAVALDPSDTDLEKSDIEVALDDSDVSEESGSEVVLLEDEIPEPVRVKGKGGKKSRFADDVDLEDVDEEESAAGALKGVRGRRRDDDEEEDEEEETVAAGAGAYRPVPWGPLPAILLLPALAFTLIGGLIAYEMLQSTWGYSQARKPGAPLVRQLADNFGMELKD